MSDLYHTLAHPGEGLYKDKGSRFLGYAFPVQTADDITLRLEEVRRLHPKARHHCYAWRLGTAGLQYRENDDGEPSGTAGRPIMGQIDSLGVTNVLVVVVRYFGGKLLGAGGLIRAYRAAAAVALQQGGKREATVQQYLQINAPFGVLHSLIPLLKREGVTLLSESYGEEPAFTASIRVAESVTFVADLRALSGVEVSLLYQL